MVYVHFFQLVWMPTRCQPAGTAISQRQWKAGLEWQAGKKVKKLDHASGVPSSASCLRNLDFNTFTSLCIYG
ncbi:hypothetical protein Y1Q_0009229 [Alligator mississippiensis]|uniref:Uncharacterized protein n=1 Tax=Alligator mississippiensis TaxID=8496 RepID=A0A151M2X7_ALLMI|nr:hypothetical protein Y1Q_0009229 [Alligator mississippiensis]